MRNLRSVLFSTVVFMLASHSAGAKLWRGQVAVVQDRDGYANGRKGPGESFAVARKVQTGQHVMLYGWPNESTRKQLQEPFWRAKLKKLGNLDRMFEWRWVITLDRTPNVPPGYAADWAYIHQSRLRVVREDAVNWGCIVDPDGYVNIRSEPRGDATVVGKINMSECFIVLDQPAYDKLDFASAGLMLKAAPWTKVFTRDGVVGWVSSKHIGLHDPRDWQYDGPVPYVL
jgi:hypothetical protein